MIWNAKALDEAMDEAAARLLKAAVALEAEHMRRLDVQNPPPFKTPAAKGQYPRKRTGFLQGHIGHDPVTVKAVRAAGKVRVGYLASAFYGSALAARGWKGIWDTARAIRNELIRIIGSTPKA